MTATLRGPKGEDVCWNPTVVKDPPLRTVESARALGFNLDGTTTGEATPKSCRHREFTGADGTAGVDNQMWRLVGCIHGWRANGYIENTADTERRNSSQGVILVSVSGVQTLQDSPAVTVTLPPRGGRDAEGLGGEHPGRSQVTGSTGIHATARRPGDGSGAAC